ncbi:hypothetical protein BDP27DRAFT_1424764 [Rhodocollybia butyracea]|uniref:Uncharacterized protein n=1 Tax=Rhodocollybia butyracea TaxID=206335 RepID=A0A9P5PLD3_9AGAR|nr:hypothetical protein BDP27DRAFT_1424764 [Rhodocollybia butyracea]
MSDHPSKPSTFFTNASDIIFTRDSTNRFHNVGGDLIEEVTYDSDEGELGQAPREHLPSARRQRHSTTGGSNSGSAREPPRKQHTAPETAGEFFTKAKSVKFEGQNNFSNVRRDMRSRRKERRSNSHQMYSAPHGVPHYEYDRSYTMQSQHSHGNGPPNHSMDPLSHNGYVTGTPTTGAPGQYYVNDPRTPPHHAQFPSHPNYVRAYTMPAAMPVYNHYSTDVPLEPELRTSPVDNWPRVYGREYHY